MIETTTSLELFVAKWQTLIGSALGPFLAIMLTVIGFFIKGLLQKRNNRKEAIRRAEIAFSQALNHIFTSISQLEEFVGRVKLVIKDVKKVTNPKTYTLQDTNFPPIINIHFDQELSTMKFKSYYLHNKILIIEYLIRWANSTILQFRDDFGKLLEKNEKMATPEKMKQADQRAFYIHNLEGYLDMVESFLSSLNTENVKSIVQAKVYNLKLMKKHFRTIYKYEGTFLKYFKNKKEMKKYNGSLEAVDRINDLMEKDTTKLILEARKRAKQHEEFGKIKN